MSTPALWHRAWLCQQCVPSGFHSDLGGHPAPGLPCTRLRVPQGAGPAGRVRQGMSLGQEVFLRPLPAPCVRSSHFLSARRGAACAWLRARQCPQTGGEQPGTAGRPRQWLEAGGTRCGHCGTRLGPAGSGCCWDRSRPRFAALALRRARAPAAAVLSPLPWLLCWWRIACCCRYITAATAPRWHRASERHLLRVGSEPEREKFGGEFKREASSHRSFGLD